MFLNFKLCAIVLSSPNRLGQAGVHVKEELSPQAKNATREERQDLLGQQETRNLPWL